MPRLPRVAEQMPQPGQKRTLRLVQSLVLRLAPRAQLAAGQPSFPRLGPMAAPTISTRPVSGPASKPNPAPERISIAAGALAPSIPGAV